jgi:DNA (cytosine-5)-methyltransferase 1
MARAGLQPHWQCTFANDIDALKSSTYVENWGSKELLVEDVARLPPGKLPGKADLAWASFPCQDLSIAGLGAGLSGDRSRAFWAYCRLLRRLDRNNSLPKLLVLENVPGTLSSNGGRDFRAICKSLAELDFVFGALILDAVHFVPQSRPRLFIVATRKSYRRLRPLVADESMEWCSTDLLRRAQESLPLKTQRKWCWWQLQKPPQRRLKLEHLVTESSVNSQWHTRTETERLLKLMTPTHMDRILEAQGRDHVTVGTIYRRMRAMSDGSREQRAEVRLDGVAGCLRTPAGGSSRQIVIAIEGKRVRTRLLATAEGAKLMGLSPSYKLPQNYYDAFRVLGDGLAVPLVRFLSSRLLLPIVNA